MNSDRSDTESRGQTHVGHAGTLPPMFAHAPSTPSSAMPASSLMAPHGAVHLREPLSVVWQGVEYPTRDWSVHGFTLETPMPRILAPGAGRVCDLTVLIGRGATRIEMRVQARAARNDDAQPTQFVFVEMDRAQAEVLHRIVDHVVAHKAMSLTQLLNETEDSRTAQKQTTERMRGFRAKFQLTLAGLAVASAAAVTWNGFATVKARYAAVTVGATTLSVPIAGTVTQLAMRPGQQVAAGEVLGYIRPSGFDQRVETLGQRRRDMEAEQAELQSRRVAMAQLSTIAVQGVDADRSRLQETVRLTERRLEIERSQMAALNSGLPTADRLRQRAAQEAVVLQAQTSVLDARARLDALAQTALLAPMGVTQGDLRGTMPTLESVDLRLAAVGAELAQMDATGVNSALGEPILSPCTCTVQQIDRRAGEWAAPSDALALLTGGETPTVHALIPGEDARAIEIGDAARVELADGTSVSGHVARLNYAAHWPGYMGLQDNVFAADRYARVEIAPDRPLTAPVGMVAQVQVITNGLWATLRSAVGV